MQLSTEVSEQLALDVAAGYFNDQQLCVRFDLSLAQLTAIKRQPAFQKELMEVRRILEDGGEQFVYQARRKAARALELLSDDMDNEEATVGQKQRAAVEIIEIAGLKKRKDEGDGGGLKLTINTNLALGGREETKGVYVLEAKSDHPAAAATVERALSRAGEDLL